jgi:hypothetical protein
MDAVSSTSGPDPEQGAAPATPPATESEAPAARRPPAPTPPAKAGRTQLSVRDMLVALGVLLVVVLVIGGLSRGFSFAPGGPTVDPAAIPVVDASAELRGLAPPVGFPLRVPAVPPDWRSNSVAKEPVRNTDSTAVRVGYLTASSQYLQLQQSDAGEEALLAAAAGSRKLAAQGVQDVGGQRWVVYGARPDEPIWIAEIPVPGGAPVRLVITGSGSEDDYRVLAGAAQAGEVLPRP